MPATALERGMNRLITCACVGLGWCIMCLSGAYYFIAAEPYQLAEVIEDKLASTPAAGLSRMDWFEVVRPREPAGTLTILLTFGPLLILFLLMLRGSLQLQRALRVSAQPPE